MTQPTDLPSTPPRLAPTMNRLSKLPFWALVAILLAVYYVYYIITDEKSTQAFWFVIGQSPEALSSGELAFKGIALTIVVALSAYALALTIGVIIGLGRVSNNVLYFNFATFYVEVIRGIPILVLLIYIAFVAVPLGVDLLNLLGEGLVTRGFEGMQWLADLTARNFSNTARVTIGLGLAYGAFEAETVRAGIESIERGQMEAAEALGMSYWQAMRLVILPQVFRRILPVLGNDLVSIIKDSSLVAVLGVLDITQLARLHAASNFEFFRTYTILAFLYLVTTITMTRIIRWLERRMALTDRLKREA